MNVRITSLVLLMIGVNPVLFAQGTFTGRVIDSETGDPLAYANVGVPGRNLGTLSDLDGVFSIESDVSYDSLLISMLGYGRIWIRPQKHNTGDTLEIALRQIPMMLNAVTIEARRRLRKQHVGWMTGVRDGTLPTDTSRTGACTVMLMEVKEAPFLLDHFLLRLTYNNKDTFRLRLRVFSVDSITGGPGEDLLNRQVFITGRRRIGWARVDLTDQEVVITERRFYIGVEWMETRENRMQFIEAMQKWNEWKYLEFLSGNKKVSISDTVQTDSGPYYHMIYRGDMRDWPGFDDLPPMTAVGVSEDPRKRSDEYVSYQRTSSFSKWSRKDWAMGLAIKIRY